MDQNNWESVPNGKRLPLEFYTRTDVVQIAQELLGKWLVTEFEGQRSAGMVTETEAYRAPDDRACHAFGNRRTARTEVMFQEGGRAYVYLCYGIHHLFNVVTGTEDMAHAVLIRAIEPLVGLEAMQHRRRRPGAFQPEPFPVQPSLTVGPGALSSALGIKTSWNGQSLVDHASPIWLEDSPHPALDQPIIAGKRIGVDYAGECAERLWRFWLKDSKWHK